MNLSDLTPEIVTPIMRELVEEYGSDYVYQQVKDETGYRACKYRDPETQKPSCLVGHVLDRAGVPYRNHWDTESWSADMVFGDHPDNFRFALQAAQDAQDCKDTWGAAFDAYLERLGR